MRKSISRAIVGTLQHPRFLPGCFIAFVVSRIALLLLVPSAAPSSDAGWYMDRAITLADEGSYSERGIPTAYWPVGYPAFLALLFKLFGAHVLVGQFANLVLASCALWLLYLVAREFLGDELVARGAVLLVTLYPNNAAYVPLLLSETLFTFLLLLASLSLFSKKSASSVLLAGVVFGLATLVKAQTILLVPVLTFIAGLNSWSMNNAFRAVLKAGAVALIALATVAPWTIRNYKVFDAFILVSTNGGMTLLGGNNSSMVGNFRKDYSDDDPLIAQAQFSVQDQVAADQRARALAIGWIKDHPGQFLQLIPKKVFRLWAPDGEGEWGYQDSPFYRDRWQWFRIVRFANQLFYLAALILFVWASWDLVRIRAKPSAYYGIAVVFMVTAVSVVFSGQSRYHFPAMPFVMCYASWALVGRRLEVGSQDGA